MDNLTIHELRDHAVRRFANRIRGEGIPRYGVVKNQKYEIATDIASNLSTMRLLELGKRHEFLSNHWVSKPKEAKIYDNIVEYLEAQIQGFASDLMLGPTTLYISVGTSSIQIDSLVDPSIQRSRKKANPVTPSNTPYA
jgi:hypothetical protein